jgi:hypothetical protein
MRTGDVLSIITSAVFGAITGGLMGGALGAAISAGIFGILALLGAKANIRPAIVSTVLVGTMAGALIGSSVVQAICLPSACVPLEIAGGVVSALVSFVGVGLVAALVARSFDEYNERAETGLPPTGVGCEVPDASNDG